MPEGFPEHWEVVAIRGEPNDMLDTDPLRIAAPKPVGDAQRAALALAPAAQQALIPAAWCQLIPDEAAMLRDWQTVNHAGLSPHEMHCHQYLGMVAAT